MKQTSVVSSKTVKGHRLQARVTPEQRRLIARAAALRGVSVKEFVVASAIEAATSAIKERQPLSLQGEARDVFVRAILNPPAPSCALRKAVRRYRQKMGP